MKNINIKPATEVPIELRKEIYKEAIEYLKTDQNQGLCLLLPMLLWDIHYLSDAPNGETWNHRDTPILFPELTKLRLQSIYDKEKESQRIPQRKRVLKQCLKDIDNYEKANIYILLSRNKRQ